MNNKQAEKSSTTKKRLNLTVTTLETKVAPGSCGHDEYAGQASPSEFGQSASSKSAPVPVIGIN